MAVQNIRVLVIGEKYVTPLFAGGPRSVPKGVAGLPESDYDERFVKDYLKFDLIICPYRTCLLHLALAREHARRPPYITLASGARHHTDRLIDSYICDEIMTDREGTDLLRRLANRDADCIADLKLRLDSRHPGSVQVKTVGFLQFLSYVSIDLHGPMWWANYEESDTQNGLDEAGFRQVLRAGRMQVLANRSGGWARELEDLRVAESFGGSIDHLAETHLLGDYGLREPPKIAFSTALAQAKRFYQANFRRHRVKRNTMLVQPIYQVPDGKEVNSPTAFMIMPFVDGPERFYRSLIKPLVEQMGITIGRADDLFAPGQIMRDIWQRINAADFIIADLTGRNPNVFYELGIAHTLGKVVILIVQSLDDVPFDIRDQRVFVYNMQFDEIERSRSALRGYIESAKKQAEESRGIIYGDADVDYP